ncbi:MAG: N-acetylglucosamine-6-phosphate deacetylase [Syntrophothermus sp.]
MGKDEQKKRITVAGGRVIAPDGLIEDGVVQAEGTILTFVGTREQFLKEHGTRPDEALGEVVDARGGFISPGFIDVHVHGGGGSDFMDGTPDAVAAIAGAHAKHGTTALLATTLTAPAGQLLKVARSCRIARESDRPGPELLGIHLEGPFISPAARGAQNAAFIRPFTLDELDNLQRESGGAVRIVTLAPEMPGVPELIASLQERGVLTSAGHTAANYQQVRTAAEKGLSMATHTFNAMGTLHHREPGAIGAALTIPALYAQLIVDGVHLHPAVVALAVRAKGPERAVLITDAIAAVGLPPGRYELGGLEIVVDEVSARLPEGNLAGSLLTMERAVKNVMEFTGIPVHEAVRMASLTPAEALGLAERKGSLVVGKDADLAVLDDEFEVQLTICRGQVVFDTRKIHQG